MLVRLEENAKNYEKYEILSCCAHDFSLKRIEKLNSLYKKTGDIDKVLEVMHKDYAWYEDPIREGNIIYVTKIPYNRDGYEKAGAIGIVFGLSYLFVGRNLWPLIIAHALIDSIDMVQHFFGG